MVDEIDKGRREFFRRAAGKTAEKVVELADARIEARASQWIRPPFAIAEIQFLLACTRCDACIEACPHEVIFKLAGRYGLDVAATPALDLMHKGCHLCADWPCVAACEAHALVFPEVQQEEQQGEGDEPVVIEPPRLAQASIDTSQCLPYLGPECGACEGSCPVEGALTWSGCQPVINEAVCVGCGLCRQACVTDPKSILIKSVKKVTTS